MLFKACHQMFLLLKFALYVQFVPFKFLFQDQSHMTSDVPFANCRLHKKLTRVLHPQFEKDEYTVYILKCTDI